MIVNHIHGGLGNQMFQYAFGQYLADRNGTDHVLDYHGLGNDPLRSYMLDRFAIDAVPAGENVRRLFPRRHGGLGWGNILIGKRPLRRIREKPYGFDPKYLTVGDQVYLRGYWQSEQFFPGQRERLLKLFRPIQPMSPPTLIVARQIETSQAISFHVRRGDYVRIPDAKLCSLNYYECCVRTLLSRYENLKIFVFSDDIPWCQRNFHFRCPTIYVDHNGPCQAHEDIWLMNRCRHHVIANSTFSWWGAWLRQSKEGEVYAPHPWFLDPNMNSKWIVPSHWRRIDDTTPKEKAA